MFEVFWKNRARGQLADIWVAGPDRNAITEAVNSIDRLLRSEPDQQGESRDGDVRILMVPPLVVDFRIDEADRQVEILAVRPIRRRHQG